MPKNNKNETNNSTLSTLCDNLRTIARNMLRLKAINKLKYDKYEQEKIVTSNENKLTPEKLDLGVRKAEYKLSKLDEADPSYDKKKKSCDKIVKLEKETMKYNEEDYKEIIKDAKEEIKEINERIEKIDSGETKMNHEDILELSTKMTKQYATEQVRTLARVE